jgi:hypothetical protein
MSRTIYHGEEGCFCNSLGATECPCIVREDNTPKPQGEACLCPNHSQFNKHVCPCSAQLAAKDKLIKELTEALGNHLSILEELDALDWGEEGRPCNWDEVVEKSEDLLTRAKAQVEGKESV